MKNNSVSQIKKILNECTYEEFLNIKDQFINDERKSVIDIIKSREREHERWVNTVYEYENRSRYEKALIDKGYKYIAGVDEVGRGPLAGPVYAAAVILNPEVKILGIKDSKKISKPQRERLHDDVIKKCICYSVASASVEEIDSLNILNATKLAMKRAIIGLKIKPEHVLIDAIKIEGLDIEQTSIIKGDDISVSIGAASVVAKVERDNYMDILSDNFPCYCFNKNKGYGTKEHIDAIRKYGICKYHRNSFLKNIIGENI